MKYEELMPIFEQRFPQLSSGLPDYYDEPYILYGQVLNPYVKELLLNGTDTKSIEDIFAFYEELAISEDEEVNNLLQVELLEALWSPKELFEKARAHMLPETRKFSDAIGAYFLPPAE